MLALGAFGLSGCATVPFACPANQPVMTVAELMFGRMMAGRVIKEAEWRRFLADEVTPRFPNGLTVYDTTGQWRDPVRNVVISEPSKVVMIIFRETTDAHAKLEAVAEAYKRRFAQQSVGILTRSACASF